MMLDHIGIAVDSIQTGVAFWENAFGYRQTSPIVENTRQKVRVVFLEKEGSTVIKLIEPSTPDSAISGFVRRGGGLHHLCFRSPDLTSALARLKNSGARCLVPPEPGEAFNNREIAFCLAPGNLNIELIDTAEKAAFRSPESQNDRASE